MKQYFYAILLLLILQACQDKNHVLEPSTGEVNQLTVIINDKYWNTEIGDSIRKKLASPIEGLPQEEPLFNLSQHTDTSGEDHFCKNRNIFIVEKSAENYFEVRYNDFALNQSVIYLSGKTQKDIINQLEKYTDSIIKTIRIFEIRETQKSIVLNTLDTKFLTDKFKIKINIPDDYTVALDKPNFTWLKKDSDNVSLNLVFYQTPFYDSKDPEDLIRHIVNMRDSVGKKHIHSQDKSSKNYMITEKSYTPYLSRYRISNKITYLTKGTWEIPSSFMYGPFLNYTFTDTKNNRNFIVEGFIYGPSASKRNYAHEIHAIITSIDFIR